MNHLSNLHGVRGGATGRLQDFAPCNCVTTPLDSNKQKLGVLRLAGLPAGIARHNNHTTLLHWVTSAFLSILLYIILAANLN